MLAPWKKNYDQPRQYIKKQRDYFANKGPSSQSYGFSSGHLLMWDLDYKESWAPKWCFWTMMLEKTLESPLDCKEIKPDHPKGNQSWIFFGRADVEAETPILWPTWCEELTHWKRPWCLDRLKEGVEGGDRGDAWMASLTQWTWVWVSSRSWWWTGRLSVLQSMGSQKVRYDWVTELTSSIFSFFSLSAFVSNREVLVLALDFSRFLTSVSLKFHVFQHLHLVLAIQTVPTYNPDLHSHVSMTLKTFLLGPRITSKSHVQNQILHLPVTFWK